jgi:SynChlorMet cassette protein ScmC
MDSYCFRLADGEGWQFPGASANRDVSQFVDKFAEIVGLRAAEEGGGRKIYFLHTDEVRRMKDGPYTFAPSPIPDESDRKWFGYDHKSLKVWCHERIPEVICEICGHSSHDEEIMNMWNALQPIYQHAQKSGGLPLHGALLEFEGKGIIIAAPGETGKSTCCRRVPGYWNPLCDDELLVVFDKKRGYRAHPFPTWSDYLWRKSEKKWDVEYSVPVQAVFFLEQARTDEAVVLGNGETAIRINRSATQVCQKFWRKLDKEHKRVLSQQLFRNSCEMAKAIRTYTLKATLEGRFWEEMEGQLRHGQSGNS